MLFKAHSLKHWIDNFYGYGSWEARTWFVSYEEGGGDLPEEVAEKVNYFFDKHSDTTSSLCNIREMYKHFSYNEDGPKEGLFPNLYEFRFGENALQNNVWKNLISFTLGFRNENLGDLLLYQKNLFASSSENSEALIRLYPLPSPHNHAWYYSWLDMPDIDFLKSRKRYERHIYSKRIQTILQKIKIKQPDVVVMYSMSNINALKKSVQEVFPKAKFKVSKAAKGTIPQHHLAILNDTTLVITTQIPTLRHNRIETGFDWYLFGRTIQEDSINHYQ